MSNFGQWFFIKFKFGPTREKVQLLRGRTNQVRSGEPNVCQKEKIKTLKIQLGTPVFVLVL